MNTCQVTVSRGNDRWPIYGACGRKVHDGEEKCRMHLNADKKRAERDRKYASIFSQNEECKKEAEAWEKKLGYTIEPYFSWRESKYKDGLFVVPRSLLEKLEGLQ